FTVPASLTDTLAKANVYDIKNVRAQGVVGSASAALTLADGVSVTSNTGKVTISSTATSKITLHTVSVNTGDANDASGQKFPANESFGVTFASSEGVATTHLGKVTVHAGGDVALSAQVDNTLDAETTVDNGVQSQAAQSDGQQRPQQSTTKKASSGPTLSITYGRGRTTSETLIADGASITGANLKVSADEANSCYVPEDCDTCGPARRGSGAAVAASDIDVSANASLGGTSTVTGGAVAVDAAAVNTKNETLTRANAPDEPGASPSNQKLDNGQNGGQTSSSQLNNQQLSTQFSAALTVAVSSTKATAQIAPNASVTAKTVGVGARTEDNFKTVAVGASAAGARTAIAGAVAIASYDNHADASIGAGAKVTADGSVDVAAQAVVPDQVEITKELRDLFQAILRTPSAFDTSSFVNFFKSAYSYVKDDASNDPNKPTLANLTDGFKALKDDLATPSLTIQDKVATTYVSASALKGTCSNQTSAQASQNQQQGNGQSGCPMSNGQQQNGQTTQQNQQTTFALSGGFLFFFLTNEANAHVDQGAQIKTTTVPAGLTGTVDKDLDSIDVGSAASSLATGDPLVYRGTNGVPGLDDGTTYYVVRDTDSSSTKIWLATSREDARLIRNDLDFWKASQSNPFVHRPIDLDTPGAGAWTLTRPSLAVDGEASYESVDVAGINST